MPPSTTPSSPLTRFFAPLVGLTSLVILLQGVEAGVFLQGSDRDKYSSWITIHGIGADVSVLLSLATLVVAALALRDRRDLVVGSALLFVLLIVESALGHLINGSIGGSDHDALTIVHIPLGMALLALTVWLAARASQWRRGLSAMA